MKTTTKQRERMREYHWKNRNKHLLQMKKYHKKWYEKNREKRLKQIYDYIRRRKRYDLNYRARKNLRRGLNQAIIYYEKYGVFLQSRKYPINYEEIIKILLPFPDRKFYQVNHIKPLCIFDLTKPEQIKSAFAPENHEWLTSEENMKRGTKWH